MKLWHGIAIIAGLALIAWGIFALVKPGGELGNNKEAATQKPPSYKADQVIAIAQAKYPACYKRENLGEDSSGIFRYTDVQTPPSITARWVQFGMESTGKLPPSLLPRYPGKSPLSYDFKDGIFL